ncbi:ABC transporter permease subunit [Marinomonas mediterranea]|jgi:ABC-type Fe3+ transport system, permease component|uniref:ABC-type transporter, integral membrane subunit n=1 Tax=Marinomonas mediterranea (strain ATCC 700492 / JCM 21426 / NBRC 103028 / MMB-1) TaxID=717774 RepID=F2JWH6_MARM1|nr:iron ABC transporter permease [Marinomonas mediterranea]ADZ90649.1 ABC-type transporter, integral membrane subunit [Marinomonas mediterranea MMB-1]WCN12745.1 ABC transporter permease subunit [Marinomonas mediterranea]WCN16819.1 ABC transporter permease subunit [Marinomonas mediterranea MMB-1]
MIAVTDSKHLSPIRRLRHKLVIAQRDPTLLIGLLLLFIFAWLIAAPILNVMLEIMTVQSGDEMRTGAEAGGMTTYYLERVFSSRMSSIIFWRPLWNTLMVAFTSMILAMVIGAILAWLLVRTNLMGRRWLSTALIIPFMLPAWTFALAWTTLFKNATIGGQPGWAEAMGLQLPDWVSYGAFPTIVIMTLNYIPFVILLVGNALRRLDSQLEEAGQMLGASKGRVALSIVFPLMRPAIMSAALLIFADAIGEFSVPYVLGLPVQFETLATSLYRAIGTQQNGVAAVFAGVILVVGMATLALDTWMMREARRFAIIGSKGAMERRQSLGILKWPAFSIALLMFFISVVIPMGALALSTVMHLPGRFNLSNFTLDYWIGTNLDTIALRNGILLSSEFWNAAWSSVRIVGSASICAGILGLLTGYIVLRSPLRSVSITLRQITFFPYLVPGIAFAAAFLTLFAVPHGPIPALYGTPIILFLALVADQMPFASRAGISAMTQLGSDVEDSARVAGAGWLRRMFSIILPIQRNALVTAVLMPFISGIKGVSLFIILAVPATDVLTTFSIRLIDFNYTQAANAVVLMIALIALLGTLLINRLTGTGLAQGLES